MSNVIAVDFRKPSEPAPVVVPPTASREICMIGATRWIEETPRNRTIIIDGRPRRLAFPYVLFAITEDSHGDFDHMRVFFRNVPLSVEHATDADDGYVWLGICPLPHIDAESRGAVCLNYEGKANRAIRYFWNSNFDTEHIAREWKSRRARAWRRATDGTQVRWKSVPARGEEQAEALGFFQLKNLSVTRPSNATGRRLLKSIIAGAWFGTLIAVMFSAVISVVNSLFKDLNITDTEIGMIVANLNKLPFSVWLLTFLLGGVILRAAASELAYRRQHGTQWWGPR